MRDGPISSGPASSIAVPKASTTRPFHELAGATVTRSIMRARSPSLTSAVVAYGLTVTLPASTRTISPCRRSPSRPTQSPSAAKGERPRTR